MNPDPNDVSARAAAWKETKEVYPEATEIDCRFCHARKCQGCSNKKHLDPRFQ